MVPVAARLLRMWRKAEGRKQGDVADELGVRQPTWSAYEAGRKTPRTPVALDLETLTKGAVPIGAWGKFETPEEAEAIEAAADAGRVATPPETPKAKSEPPPARRASDRPREDANTEPGEPIEPHDSDVENTAVDIEPPARVTVLDEEEHTPIPGAE